MVIYILFQFIFLNFLDEQLLEWWLIMITSMVGVVLTFIISVGFGIKKMMQNKKKTGSCFSFK